MLNIVLFGPPGAGKGTQADKLLEKYKILHISTGEVIRNEIKAGSELGIQVQKEMEGGGLASDSVVVSIIGDYIKSNKDSKGAIYDGFPRTTPQAEAFDAMLKQIDEEVTIVLSLEVEDEELITRLLNRGLTSGRADDQNREIIENRIKVYKSQTELVKDHYKKQNKVIEINGIGSVDAIFERLCNAIGDR